MRVLKGAAEAGEACPDRQSRPLALAAAVGAAAHHGYELASGAGLVWQPEFGLGPAAALWTAQIGSWVGLAWRGPRRADPVLAALSGASLAGVAAHFVLWPHKRGFAGLPELTKADGLASWQMPTYNTILRAWALASAGSIALEVPRGSRRWSLLGGALLPLFVVSARHHFKWVKEQAASNPAWWNRGVALGDTSS
jgi:hypothetical protein